MQFNDGSQLVVQAGVSCIAYTSPDGRTIRYNRYNQVHQSMMDIPRPSLSTRVSLSLPSRLAPRYKENEKLPEPVKEKLHCLSTILGLLANPAVQRLHRPH